ncbi:MAG: hypothetical protein A2Y86_04855 [Candidatus Aminicenantes bacterium RBG_13_62_12]|nr:MAG: hypothetical protein A2Y86_04855 [Candidatus Aminicenantes bacterium RBG_13_62_12]
MDKKSEKATLHQKLEAVIYEMVDKDLRLDDSLREFQKIYLETAMKKYNGNKSRMANALGIHRNTLHCRAKKLKIHRKYQ